ncbi:MAG: response regulator, partial [Leptospiraceae bacterium]|nr:response regulator [Leptospiraceae bacterium]
MALRVLIVDDNHSFIDSLKVMLRDLSLDFSHAYRYSDALKLLQEHGSFYTPPEDTEKVPKPESGKQAGANIPLVRNEQGFFLIIVEQNAETS